MSSKVRGWFLIIGSIIGFIGYALPGLYGVSYHPPAHAAFANIAISSLRDFGGAFSSAKAGVYSGFGGPVDFHITLIALGVSFALGLFGLVLPIDHGVDWIE